MLKKIRDWKQKLRPWQRRLLFIVLLVSVYFAAQFYNQRHLVSGPIPIFSAVTLKGELIDSNDWQPEPVLIHFWATWCPVCRLEQDTINSLAKDHRVITVAMDSGGAAAVKKYMQQHQLTFPVIVDPDGELSRRFGVSGVPTGFVVDSNRQIRFKEIGLTSGWGWRARLWLASLF